MYCFKINGFRFVFELEMVFGTIADVGFAFVKGNMLVYKIPIHPIVSDDLITDGIGHGQIRLGSEKDRFVRSLAGAGGAGGKIDDLDMFFALAIGEHS